jgi:uncharacterized protein YdeI (YjbR/CyaY-like superfamily)
MLRAMAKERWHEELEELKRIARECDLTEEVKWRQPCFTLDGRNVLILGTLKDACIASFFKGALLKDPEGLLVKPGENSRFTRYLRFTSVDEVREREPIVKAYIREAVEAERAGLTVDVGDDEPEPPEELVERLAQDPDLAAAWDALTPGRRRGYVIHVAGAKQPATRTARIDRQRDRILEGKGLHDR